MAEHVFNQVENEEILTTYKTSVVQLTFIKSALTVNPCMVSY